MEASIHASANQQRSLRREAVTNQELGHTQQRPLRGSRLQVDCVTQSHRRNREQHECFLSELLDHVAFETVRSAARPSETSGYWRHVDHLNLFSCPTLRRALRSISRGRPMLNSRSTISTPSSRPCPVMLPPLDSPRLATTTPVLASYLRTDLLVPAH